MPSVKSVRSEIDQIDTQILDLLSQRLKFAREAGLAKAVVAKKAGRRSTVLVPEREEEIFRRLRRIAEAEKLPWPLVQAVFRDVISLCRAAQGKVTAHLLGPMGTHSEWAARACFGEALALKYAESIPKAIKATEQAIASGDANAVAVVPLENSLEGTVTATVDAMLATSLKLVGEGFYRVRHALLTKAASLSEVRTVYSHPMGFAQCRAWLQQNIPHAKCVEVGSTAEAAKHATGHAAAIVSPYLAASLTGARVLASDIQDSLENTTRFGILGAQSPGVTGDDKTSLVFSLPNKSGSLLDAIQVFSKHRLNMTKIESRPHRGLQWEYLFFVDVDGHAQESKVAKALEVFGTRVRYFKILGTYPKGRAWN